MSDLNGSGAAAGNGQEEKDKYLIKSLIQLCEILNGSVEVTCIMILALETPMKEEMAENFEINHEVSPNASENPHTKIFKILCQSGNEIVTLTKPRAALLSENLVSDELRAIEDITQFPDNDWHLFSRDFRFLLTLPFQGSGLGVGCPKGFEPDKTPITAHKAPLLLCLLDAKPRILTPAQISMVHRTVDVMARNCYLQARAEETFCQLRQLSHDLRTPLTSITMLAQMLQSEPGVTETMLQMLDQILIAARKMDNLLTNSITYGPH